MGKFFVVVSLLCAPAMSMEQPPLLVSIAGVLKQIFRASDAVSLGIVDKDAKTGMSIQVKSETGELCLGPSLPLGFNRKIYVSYYMSSKVAVLHPREDFRVLAIIDLFREGSKFGAGPLQPVLIADKVWVTHQFDSRISIIDPNTYERVTLEVGRWPEMPTLNGAFVEVFNVEDKTTSYIDPNELYVVGTYKKGLAQHQVLN